MYSWVGIELSSTHDQLTNIIKYKYLKPTHKLQIAKPGTAVELPSFAIIKRSDFH